MTVLLRSADGSATPMALARWSGPAAPAEIEILTRLHGPVIDLGCGPGRLVVALAAMGIAVLGIDASPIAVALADAQDAVVLQRSVFGHLPGEGRWRSALLFDGNIGIGGDPVTLLRRVASLLHPRGRAVVEADPPGHGSRVGLARIERDAGASDWFPWAWVGVDALPWMAASAGMTVTDVGSVDGRWFATLERSS